METCVVEVLRRRGFVAQVCGLSLVLGIIVMVYSGPLLFCDCGDNDGKSQETQQNLILIESLYKITKLLMTSVHGVVDKCSTEVSDAVFDF